MTDTHSHPKQLPLQVNLPDDAAFENFHVPASHVNALAVRALQQQLQPFGEQFIFLSGPQGSGVTHLLQAACRYAVASDYEAQYVPLDEFARLEPRQMLESLETLDLVCFDNLQAVLGSADWEGALFGFFNIMRDTGKRVVMAANRGPRELSVVLPDLQSRLVWGLVFQLQPLTDDDKRQVLKLRAKARGLELSDEVAEFIMRRAPRHTSELFNMLQRLDEASLIQHRRLTIPFVKDILGY